MSRVVLAGNHIPAALRGWLLVDDFGIPRYWPAVWQTLRGPELARGTLGSHLAAIERLYQHAEASGTQLDRAIADVDTVVLSDVLGGFLVALTNHHARTGKDTADQWHAAMAFVSFIVRRLSPNQSDVDGIERHLAEQRLFLSNLMPSKRKAKAKRLRALPASVVEELLEVANPDHPRNPYRDLPSRWRNYALLLLLLTAGLRRGEALLLQPSSIHDEIDRRTGKRMVWLNVRESHEEDCRHQRPSIKTVLSSRQIPLDESVVSVVDHYVNEYRGEQPHAFLFASNRNLPLSAQTVERVFDRLSSALSPAAAEDLKARNGAASVSPHDCRHTCAVARLGMLHEESGGQEEAFQLLRTFFGWSKNSEMPLHYAEAHFEDRLKVVFANQFDSRVAMLRQLRVIQENSGLLDQNTTGEAR